jgi:gluconate kinase
MSLRPGDIEKEVRGKIIWIIGRGGSGKSSLIAALQEQLANLVLLDDFLRVRAGIHGASLKAYDGMIGLSWSLAIQGFDCIVPCGAQTLELRNYVREKSPTSLFIYIAKRGRPYPNYEEPTKSENILVLDGALTIEQEVEIVLEKIWKTKPTQS